MRGSTVPGPQVKVVEVRIDQNGRERIGCSIKAVDQDTGADLVRRTRDGAPNMFIPSAHST